MTNFDDFFKSENPLTREAALFLIDYAEEDNRIDYKQTINVDEEKDWINITKDISAFANTYGGYLVFGVVDSDKSIKGLNRKVETALKDANNLLLKINSYVEPDIKLLRSKAFRVEGKSIVIIYIPRSFNKTHIIKKDGVLYKQSKTPKTILNKGTYYVRRSASNHLGDSRDFDDIVEMRIDQFREALIDKVARVVNTPADSNLFILSKDPSDQTGEKFIIEDSPDSIAVKGMSFTVSPDCSEEEIAAWTVLSSNRTSIKPPEEVIWEWYDQRESIQISQTHKLAVFQFSLWVSAPAFYWIQGIEGSLIRESLLNALRNRPVGIDLKQFLAIASFLGKASYNAVLKNLGEYVNRISPRHKTFPVTGARNEFGTIKSEPKQSIKSLRIKKLEELNKIVSTVVNSKKPAPAMKKWKAQDIDCFMYSQDDNYKNIKK